MALDINNYEAEFRYGGLLAGKNSSQKAAYNTLSANTTGTTYANLFATGSTSPTAGTITSVGIVAGDTTKGTIDLVSDQGTLVRMIKNGTNGGYTGSMIANIAFQPGSLMQIISAGSDNAAVEVTYYTFA